MSDDGPDQISFRDPSGRLAVVQGRALRALNTQGNADFETFKRSTAGQRFLDAQQIIPTRKLDPAGDRELEAVARHTFGTVPNMLLEHELVPFPSYPHEWPPEMLHAAGTLTLQLAREFLKEGMGIKDATPFNILYRGPKPVFVDILSFEKRDPCNSIWLAEAQFCRSFILPLLVYKNFSIPPSRIFLISRDGIAPDEVYALAGSLKKFSPSFFRWATLPTWIGRAVEDRSSALRYKTKQDPKQAQFILNLLFRRLEKGLNRVAPVKTRKSIWSEYDSCTHYDNEAREAKRDFVARSVARIKPRWALDVGCNTGNFSRIAAESGASVVAVDSDPVVLGRVWHMACETDLNILPLVQNIANPSPAMGWQYRECLSFLDRASGCFNIVFLLAVVHHLLVAERVPLDDLVDLTAALTTNSAIVEFVGPDDPMFILIARGREHLHRHLTQQSFETAWRRRFRIIDVLPVPNSQRFLYLCLKK